MLQYMTEYAPVRWFQPIVYIGIHWNTYGFNQIGEALVTCYLYALFQDATNVLNFSKMIYILCSLLLNELKKEYEIQRFDFNAFDDKTMVKLTYIDFFYNFLILIIAMIQSVLNKDQRTHKMTVMLYTSNIVLVFNSLFMSFFSANSVIY